MKKVAIAASVVFVAAVLIWQAIASHGNPDPTAKGLSPAAMIFSSAVLVFREGLEAVLVLAAVTAGVARTSRKDYLRAVPFGAGLAFLASIVTWFIVVAVISHVSAPALDVQAATGLLAIIVLLVIMNWFFHKVYWTGWITGHSNRRKKLMDATNRSGARLFVGMALLGFTAIYREGFEIVLFLQNLRLRAGSAIVLEGAAVGLALTGIVAALTFMAHKKLPYKKMLVYTGVLLGVVLLVMVGEEAQEMQLAGWLHTTSLHVPIPDWMGVWFSVFPTVETLVAQVIAATLVIGSYVLASRGQLTKPDADKDLICDPMRQALLQCICECGGAAGYDVRTGLCDGGTQGAVAACEISCRVPCPPSKLVHHLTKLRQAGLIETERRGRIIYATLRPEVRDRLGSLAVKR